MRSMSSPLNLSGLCHCFDQQIMGEVTLCQFPGLGLNRLEAYLLEDVL